MARKIKETPVLVGKEARAFSRATKDNIAKKVPNSDFKRAQANFKRIQLV